MQYAECMVQGLTALLLFASQFGLSGCMCQLVVSHRGPARNPHAYIYIKQRNLFSQFACVCVQLTLQPLWRELSTNPTVRCEDGDPFDLLVGRIGALIVNTAEDLINEVIDGINNILDSFPWPLSLAELPTGCFPTATQPERCLNGGATRAERAKLTRCEDSKYGLEELCYYARVRLC